MSLLTTDEELGFYKADDPYGNWVVSNRPLWGLLQNDRFLAAEILRLFAAEVQIKRTPEDLGFFSENNPGFCQEEKVVFPNDLGWFRRLACRVLVGEFGVPVVYKGRRDSDNVPLLRLYENDLQLAAVVAHLTGTPVKFPRLRSWSPTEPFLWSNDNRPLRDLVANDVTIVEALGTAPVTRGGVLPCTPWPRK